MAEFNTTHLEEIERRLALLDKVNMLGQAISASLDLGSLLQVVTTRVTSILGCYTAVVAFVEGNTVTLQTIIYSQDSEPQRISRTRHIDDHPSIILKAIRELKTQNVPDGPDNT